MGPRFCSAGSCPLKSIPGLIATLLVAGGFSVYAFSLPSNGYLSATRFFSLDGNWYSVGKPSSSNFLLWEELRKQGIDIGRIPRESLDSGDFVLHRLYQIPPKKRFRLSSLPSCLRVENNMEMESGLGFLDITSGKISSKGTCARKDLAAQGWTFVDRKERAMPVCIGTIRNGRETAIVFLEENEGDFLYIRQLEK